jgi:dTDP-4-dehydrorhamnose reductase
MKVWVTGEAGCIARNLSDLYSKYDVVNSLSENYYDYWRSQITSPIKELNIFDPSLPKLIRDSGAEAIIHTANINYDLAKNDPQLALHTHIDGAWVISKIAKELNIPLLNIHPIYAKNFYFETFYCGDRFIKTNAPQHATIELPTVYGKYDSSSYIAKMILTPQFDKAFQKIKLFLH